ncbi:hypothetical protein EBU99_13780 [bacterium]|nr:hypothetical protein [bacterium]
MTQLLDYLETATPEEQGLALLATTEQLQQVNDALVLRALVKVRSLAEGLDLFDSSIDLITNGILSSK